MEELLNSKHSKDVTVALDEIGNNDEKQASFLNSLVLKLVHSRDNHLIEEFLKHLEGTKYWTQAFHALVLKLTCNDDWHTLDTVLHYGKDRNLEPRFAGDNPIVLASEQVKHLFTMQILEIIIRDTFSAPKSCMVLGTGSMDQSQTRRKARMSRMEQKKSRCWVSKWRMLANKRNIERIL